MLSSSRWPPLPGSFRPTPAASLALRATGVALPQTLRPAAAD
jgi:hypothetical protein